MRIRVSSAIGQPSSRLSPELDSMKNAILGAKTDAELVAALRAVKGEDEWEELPDLYDWCGVLDRMDEALETAMYTTPSLLLIQPTEDQKAAAVSPNSEATEGMSEERRGGNDSSASGSGDIAAVTGVAAAANDGADREKAGELVLCCLNFLAILLRNCVNKHVFSSVEHLRALLSAREDAVAESALRCLMLLTVPPLLHRHQQPELHSMCSIHNDKVMSAELMTLSSGWGGRGQGLGLLACVTGRVEGEQQEVEDNSARDSPSQTYLQSPVLPASAGDLYFEYTPLSVNEASDAAGESGKPWREVEPESNRAPSPGDYTESRTIYMPVASATEDGDDVSGSARESSASMFERLSAEHPVPKRRLFSLLARVRAAVAWRGGLESRRSAVRRRIMALTAMVYCHPSQEALMAYVSIQPELIQELVDLVRVRTNPSAQSTVPLDISVLAVHCLAALVHTRNGGSNLGVVARHTHVFQELGITRGQYTGLLPLLVRHGVASLFLMPEQDVATATVADAGGGGSGVGKEGDHETAPPRDGGWEESKASGPGDAHRASPPRPDAALSLGMAFVEAAGAKTKKTEGDQKSTAMEYSDPAASETATAVGNASAGKGEDATLSKLGGSSSALSEIDQLRWVEAVFSLVWAVVSLQHGAAAMTECGLIPALLNVVQLNMDGQGFGGIGRPFHRRYVVSQAVQIMETAVVNNTAALSTFRELGAAEVLASAFSTEIRRLRDADSAPGSAASDGGLSEDGEGEDAAAAAGVEAKGKGKKSAGGKAKGKGKGRDKGGEGSTRGAADSPLSSNAPDGDSERTAPLAVPSPSQKALLFSLLNALSITFQNQTQGHQQVGSDPLLEAFLTAAVLDVFRNSDLFGGVLVALTATLISDVANQDPSTTVAYLLRSGIVDAYLKVLTASPPLPSTEFVVTVPQVLHALCLTHDGASRVQEANVFPSLFGLLRSSDYVHPQTRSPDGNVTNVVGAGLDELMRHVPALRPSCIKSLVAALKEMVAQGDALLQREISGDSSPETLNERYLLQQYAANFGQLVETALSRPENSKPFGDEGGDEVVLSMFPLALPGPWPLLARASCCWGHNSQGLANHAAAHSLTSAMKALGSHDTGRLVKRILSELDKELNNLEAARQAILDAGGMSAAVAEAELDGGSDVMEVDSQSTPGLAPASASTSRPGSKSSPKELKGKGKGRASDTGAAAAAAESKAKVADNEDDDVVMSDTFDASRGNSLARDPEKTDGELDVVGLLDRVPREPVYVAWPLSTFGTEAGVDGSGSGSGSDPASLNWNPMPPLQKAFAGLLRSLAVTEWLAGALTLLARWAHSREARSGGGQQGSSSWWGRMLLAGDGRRTLERLMKLHRHVLMEVSRARADHHEWLRSLEAAEAEEVDREQRSSPRMPWREPDFYRLLIVAHDGAVVGSSLDSDGSVPAHTLEFGTVVVAYERAGNSTGVTRYRTRQGWISETARGSGRQPIAEVIAVGLAGETDEDDVSTASEKRRRLQQKAQTQALLQSSASRHRPVNGLRAAGAGTLARLHTVMKQLTTSFSRVLAGSLPRPHHRDDVAQTMNPMAPAACEFLSESLQQGLALGLSKTGSSQFSFDRELSPEARCTHLAGMLETASSALFDERRQTVNTLLLVRMERKRMPLRLILEACSFILTIALEMSSDPGSSASPTFAFKGGVEIEEMEEQGGGSADAAAPADSLEGIQQAWEALNRQIDARDSDVSQAGIAAAAGGGVGTRDRELPPPMLEVLKVSLSMLRRLSNRILVLAGPFGPLMQAFPPGHPQRRDWDNALAMAGEPVPPIEDPSVAGRHSSTSGAAGGVEEEKEETPAGGEADSEDGDEDDVDNDEDDNDEDDDDDDDENGQSPNATAGTSAAAGATAAVGTTPSTSAPMAVEDAAAPDASTVGGDRAEGGQSDSSAGDDTSAVKAAKSKVKEKGKGKAKDPPPPFSPDLFLRRVHLLVGGVLEPLWRDPRLPNLPHDAVARLLSAVLETMQTLQSEGSHSSLLRQRQRAQARHQERAASAAASGRGSSGGGSGAAGVRGAALAANRWNFLSRVREPAATPVPFAPDERTVTQVMEMGFTREHVVAALRATETNRVEVAMEYLLTHPPPPPSASAASAPAPAPASAEAAPAAAGMEAEGLSTEASAGASNQAADPGASSSANAEGGSSETPGGETRAAAAGLQAAAAELQAAAAGLQAATAGLQAAAAEASRGASTQQQVSASRASSGAVDAHSPEAASGSVAEGGQPRRTAGSRSSASGSSRNAGLREIIASLEEMTDSGQQQQQLSLRPRSRQVTASAHAGASAEGDIPSINARWRIFSQPSVSATGNEVEPTGTPVAPAPAAQQQGTRSRTDTTLSQVLEEALSRISAASDGDEGGSSAEVDEDAEVESAPDEDVIMEEVEIMQRMEALLTEAGGIRPLSGILPADDIGGRPVQAGSTGSGEGSESSGAAVMPDAEGFGEDSEQGTDAAAAAFAALAAADAERESRHGAAATESMAGSSNSARAMFEERRSTANRLRRAIERTIGRAMSASSLPSSAMDAATAEAASSSSPTTLTPASAARAAAPRDEVAEKEKAAAEKSHQAREEAELKKVCSAIKTLLARFQVSVEEACFRLVAEADSQGSPGGSGAGTQEQQWQGWSRRRSRERSTSASPSMSFLVANFLSEQARTHRSHRVSDPRADLPASQESAGAARGTSASASASVPVVEGSQAPPATAPATQESVAREPDGGGGSETGGIGAVLAGARPLGPGAGPGTSTRSLSSGAALDASSLVLSCISRAEAMLPPLGSTSTGGEAAHPGLGGMLHVLLLLATGVTETQRGALVMTGFHLKLIDLFKATIAAMRREQQQQRRGRQGEPSATVAPAAAAEWPQYMTPCLLLLDLLAKRSNVSKDDDTNQKVEDGARNHDRAQQHHLRLRRVQQRDQGAPRPDEAGSASSAQPLLAPPPSLSWQRGDREDGSGGTGAGGGAGDPGDNGASSSVPSSARSTVPAEATVSGGDSGGGWRGERTPSQRQGSQESGGARTTETTSSSSTNPTEGGPPGLAESKDGDEDGGESGQASAVQPSTADAGTLKSGDTGAFASPTSAISAGPPELHVLLSPEQMSDLLELFIDFFAGVAVPPPAREAARADAEKEAAWDAEETGETLPAPSSNLVFASLQLLARLVRDYGRASRFITAGGASSLMALPGASAFEGSTALLAVVFRHLLEDPTTLQSAMETEIRAAFGRLSRSSGAGSGGRGKVGDGRTPPAVRLLPLMSALRPLVLRDGDTLIRAAANVLRRVDAAPDGGGGADGGSGGGGAGGGGGRTAMVTLTTPFGSAGHQHQERANPGASAESEVVAPSLAMLARAASRQRSLGDRRSSAGSVVERHDRHHGRTDAASVFTPVAGSSAAPHQNRTTIMSLLLSELILRNERIVRRYNGGGAGVAGAAVDDSAPTATTGGRAGTGADGGGEFLGEVGLLELLSDLVLHLPACATSIHRFGHRERSMSHAVRLLAPTPRDAVAPRPGSVAAVARAIRILQAQRHAVPGSEPPSPTVVAFLLHELLPSPRAGDTVAKGIVDAEERRKRKALSALQGRKAQAAARLLLALCARAGEGRRRVLVELYSSLACHSAADGVSNNTRRPRARGRRTNTEMWALQAWGELALGLAAPRAAHVGGNEYGNQTLAWDVVRAVTDLGAVSALTRALSRMDLNHSRASSCGAALVRPLEMFTRASVAESLRRMKAKDDGRGAAADTGVQPGTAVANLTTPSTVSTVTGAVATTSGAGSASGTAGAGASTPNRRTRGRRRESREPVGVVGGATPGTGEGGGGSGTGARTPGRARGSSSRSSSRRRASTISRTLPVGSGDGVGLGSGSVSGVGRSGGVEGDGEERRGSGPGTDGAGGAVSAEASRSRAAGASGRGGASGGRARALQEIGSQSFADDDVMLDEAFGGQPEGRRDEMLVEVDLSAIVADMEHEGGADGGDHHDDGQVVVSFGSHNPFEMDDHEASEMLHAAPSDGGGRGGRRSNLHGIGSIDLEDHSEEEEEEDAGGLGGDGHDDDDDDEDDDDDDDDDEDDDDDDDDADGDEVGDDAEDGNVVGQGVSANAIDEDEEEEDGDEEEEEEEELGEDDIDLDGNHGDEGGVYVLGGDEEIPVELDWGTEDMFEPPDLAAIYAQVGWDGTGGIQRAGGGRSGAHRLLHGGGGAGGREGGGGGWIPGDGIHDHLHVWGGQPPPGLARQYATTRVGDRGVGMNVISWNDFIESVESDSALSQMLRSVPGGGGGGPPFVRVVRGQGADGRWTEMITQDMNAVPPGPSPNTTRLFPDGPSAATQAHAAPVVHPLLLAHSRHGGGSNGSSGGSSRNSGRRSSRLGVGGGGGSASSRHHAALGLLTHERLIWDGHVGGGAAGPPALEHTMMDALEGLNLVVNQPGAGRNGSDPAGASRRLQGAAVAAAAAGAGGPGAPVANEGRWTDNGQPLTAAEGRTVLPILEQVEQAIVTRLLPSQAALDRAQAASENPTSGDAGARAEAKDEEKEEQEEQESKEEQRDPDTLVTTAPVETAVRGERSAGDGLGTTGLTPHDSGGGGGGGTSSLEASAARDSVADVVERAMDSVPTAGSRGSDGDGAGEAAVAAVVTPPVLTATPMAVEDSASVSEGEAVAVLASSLSLSPSREAAEAPTEASARPDEQVPATQEALAATQETEATETAEQTLAANAEAGSALAALLHGADQYVAAVEAMDVVVEGNGDVGVEESKEDEGEDSDGTIQEEKAEEEADEEDDDEENKENEDGEEELHERQEEEEDGEEEVGGGEEADPGDGAAAGDGAEGTSAATARGAAAAGGEMVCPPGMDPEVFAQLPPDMQQEVIREHRNTVGSMEDQAELLEAAGLDPEALAALPPEMRREVLEQEARNRRMREAPSAPPADPSRAEEMDNASFVATLPPELRREVLLSADEALLNTLPPNLVAEAMVMRERVPHQVQFHAMAQAQAAGYASGARAGGAGGGSGGGGSGSRASAFGVQARRAPGAGSGGASGQRAAEAAKDNHEGELRLEADLKGSHNSPPPVPRETLEMIIRLLYLLSPVRPHRLLQRTALNLCACHPVVRKAVIQSLVHLIKSDPRRLRLALKALPRAIDGPRGTTIRQQQQRRKQSRLKMKVSDGGKDGGDGSSEDSDSEIDEGKGAAGGGGGADGGGQPDAGLGLGMGPWSEDEEFPPRRLLGPASDSTPQPTFAATVGTSVGSSGAGGAEVGRRGIQVHEIHPMVARRGREFLHYLCKTSFRVRYEMLTTGPADDRNGDKGDESPSAPLTGSLGETHSSGKTKGKGKKTAQAAQHNKGKGKMVVESMDVGDDHRHPNARRGVETEGANAGVLLEQLMDLLDRPLYTMSGPDLEELLQLIEVLVAPLEDLKLDEKKPAVPTANAGAGDGGPTQNDGSVNGAQSGAAAERGSQMEIDSLPAQTAAGASEAAAGSATGPSEKYEWVKLPAPVVRTERLRLLCSVLRLEACSDSSFQRVGKVVSNLSKVPQNRATLLNELVSVAKSLGAMSTQDLQTLGQELDVVKRDMVARASHSKGDKKTPSSEIPKGKGKAPAEASATGNRGSSTSGSRGAISPIVVNLNSSSSELKLLRVLQTLINLTGKDVDTLDDQLRALELDDLWEALSSCLAVVSVLEGVADEEEFLDETLLQGGGSGGGGAASSEGARGVVAGTDSGPRSTTGESREARQGEGSAADPVESGAQTAKRTSAMAGLVARFLPVVEAFFVANAREPRGTDLPNEEEEVAPADGGGTPAAEGVGEAGREEMEEEDDADGSSPAAAAEEGVGSAPTTASSQSAASPAATAAVAAAAGSLAPAGSASATGSQPAEASAAAPAPATETASVNANAPGGATEPSDGAGAGEERESGRIARRESVHRVTTMPGARFRKNVPRNMRPLVEAEDDKATTPESLRLSRFVARHKSLLNALLHQNPTLLEKSLSAMVYNPRCRQHLDFENKRAFFRSQLRRLRQHSTRRYGSLRLTVPRNEVFEYSFHQLRVRNAEEMRGRLHITFQNEDGIDAGGLTREWYSILARDIFNQNYALFIAAADGATFQPNPVSHVNSDHLAYFKFVGRIVGKAIADGQALDAHFTQSFYKHILGVTVTHQDMQAIDPDYYKNLLQITALPLEALGLDLTFSTDTEMFGRHEVVDLIPNGRNIMVTDENKLEYVQRITHHRMTHSIRDQIEAFLEGFHDLVPPELISIFTPKELELLISGLPDVDVDDLQNNTEYTNFKSTDKEIQWFWNVLRSFSREDLALFLQYVTGTSKVPLGGFALLQGMRGIQKFNIHKAFGGSHLLPAAHTCFNQLDLPKYTSEEMTRDRILLAIHEGSEGFGFG